MSEVLYAIPREHPKLSTPSDASPAPTLEEFIQARGNALWRAAFALTGDHAAAEDLVQTAFVKSWHAYNRVGASNYERYVQRIMFNAFVSHRRLRWTREITVEQVAERSADQTLDVDSTHDLRKAVLTLPRAQRAVIVLRFFEDLTEAQTADVLGVSLGTVKSHSARALATLRVSKALAERDHQ